MRILGAQRKSNVELRDAISPQQHPVAAAWQHLSLEPGTRERTARHVQDAAGAQGRARQDLRVVQLRPHLHEKFAMKCARRRQQRVTWAATHTQRPSRRDQTSV